MAYWTKYITNTTIHCGIKQWSPVDLTFAATSPLKIAFTLDEAQLVMQKQLLLITACRRYRKPSLKARYNPNFVSLFPAFRYLIKSLKNTYKIVEISDFRFKASIKVYTNRIIGGKQTYPKLRGMVHSISVAVMYIASPIIRGFRKIWKTPSIRSLWTQEHLHLPSLPELQLKDKYSLVGKMMP